MRVKRPSHYFDPNNTAWPDVVEFRIEMPTDLELDYGIERAQHRIATWWMRLCRGARCGPAP